MGRSEFRIRVTLLERDHSKWTRRSVMVSSWRGTVGSIPQASDMRDRSRYEET